MIDSKLPETRDILLTAATRVFASHGYNAATIRQICELAGANVASVNYHFGDKQTLYGEVLAAAFEALDAPDPVPQASQRTFSATERFGVLVEKMVRALHAKADTGEGSPGQLLAWEVLEPSPVLQNLARTRLEPAARHFFGGVRELIGPDADEQTIRACGLMVLTLILFSPMGYGATSKLFPDWPHMSAGIESIAKDIARLSIAALRQHAGVEPDDPGGARAADGGDTETEIHLL